MQYRVFLLFFNFIFIVLVTQEVLFDPEILILIKNFGKNIII